MPFYSLIGVVGIDITIADLVNIVSTSRIGYDSYPFLINDDGEVIYHPRLPQPDDFTADFTSFQARKIYATYIHTYIHVRVRIIKLYY